MATEDTMTPEERELLRVEELAEAKQKIKRLTDRVAYLEAELEYHLKQRNLAGLGKEWGTENIGDG